MKTIKVAHDPKTNLFMINWADLRGYSSIKVLVDENAVKIKILWNIKHTTTQF